EITRRFVEFETANPAKATGYFLHAKALIAQSADPEAARKLLEKSLSIDGRDSAAHFELGAIHDRARRYEDAAREFERAAELVPSDPAPHYRLSRVYDRLGKRDAADAERARHASLVKAQEVAK